MDNKPAIMMFHDSETTKCSSKFLPYILVRIGVPRGFYTHKPLRAIIPLLFTSSKSCMQA